MNITRSSLDTAKGPADWFTGEVYLDTVAVPEAPARAAAALVHFTPGARTAWHTHPYGQTIFVTEGIGLCQREGGPVEEIRPGDRVHFEPGENHWHVSVDQIDGRAGVDEPPCGLDRPLRGGEMQGREPGPVL